MTSVYGGFGALRLPAPSVVSATELDPGQEAILGLLECAINSELGEAWRGIVSSLPSTHYLVRAGNALPVQYVSSLELTPQQMTQFRAEWPVLAVYREGEPEFGWLSTQYRKLTQRWSADWIVGPLSAAHINRIGRFAIAVRNTIELAITYGMHPAFAGGHTQFHGQFSEITCVSSQGPGVSRRLTEESGSGYYGLTVEIETVERMVYDGYASAGAVDVDAGYIRPGTATDTPLTEIWIDVEIENES